MRDKWRSAVYVRTGSLLLLILVIAAALRTYDIRAQPVFIDEDLYTAAVLRLDSWSPRSVGRMAAQVVKPPLPLVAQAVAAGVTSDAVTAGRLLSAGSGVVTTLLTYFVGRRLAPGTPMAGLIAAAVYALSPVAVLHERMVLPDGLLTATSIAAVLVSWTAVERGDSRRALFAGAIGFMAVQMKLSGLACIAAPVLVLVASKPITPPRVSAAVIAGAGPPVSYLLLRLSPLGPFLRIQDEARLAVLTSVQTNLEALYDSAVTYVPALVAVLVVFGAARLFRVNRAYLVVVLGMLGVWSVPWLLLSNFAPSRYDLPAVPYLAALAGVGAPALIDGLAACGRQASALAYTAVIGTLATTGVLAGGVAANLQSAQLSALDDWQYRSGWPAGGMYARAADFVSSTPDVTGRVYIIDARHAVAAGAFEQRRGEVWLVDRDGPFPLDAHGDLLVMLDDVRRDGLGDLVADPPSAVLDNLQQRVSGTSVVAFFPSPNSDVGVAVLRLSR